MKRRNPCRAREFTTEPKDGPPEPPPNQVIKEPTSGFLALLVVLGFLGMIMALIAAWVRSW